MKKKLLTAALCLAVSFALSACGGNGADGTTAGKTDAATEGASQAAGSNTVVVAMGSGFSTLDPVSYTHLAKLPDKAYEGKGYDA